MNIYIILVAVAVIAWLIIRSSGKSDPASDACANEVIQLLREDKDASVEQIASVYKNHSRTPEDIDKVTLLVKTRIAHTHIPKDKHDRVMRRVREAKSLL